MIEESEYKFPRKQEPIRQRTPEEEARAAEKAQAEKEIQIKLDI